jgi:PTH2 family peptidyl-tRNA hydrolase
MTDEGLVAFIEPGPEPEQALTRRVITLRIGGLTELTDIKQVIVVRSDLKMGKGKVAAQVAHAALEASEAARLKHSNWYKSWREQGQAKVVVKTDGGEAALLDLQRQARSLGLPSSLIQDRGLTQLDPGTTTCLAIGPAPSGLADKVTGDLKLL